MFKKGKNLGERGIDSYRKKSGATWGKEGWTSKWANAFVTGQADGG